MRRRIAASVLAVVSVVVLAACGGSNGSAGSAAGKQVGFLVFNEELDTFVTAMVDGVKASADEQGLSLTTVDGKADLPTQEAAIDQFVSDGVDAILLYPGDPTSLVPAVQKAADAGIPVFTLNLGLEKGAPVVTYVGSDDYDYGKKQGELVVQALGEDGGTVALLMGTMGTSAQIARTAGFTDALKGHDTITIVDQQSDKWDPATSLAITQQWAAKYPAGQLDAIVAQGPQITGDAAWAFGNGRSDILFIAGDYNTDVQKAIVDGQVYGTVEQNPDLQGREAITAIAQWLGGQQDKVQTPAHYTPLPVITRENAATTAPAW